MLLLGRGRSLLRHRQHYSREPRQLVQRKPDETGKNVAKVRHRAPLGGRLYRGTSSERLLPNLLPNAIARNGNGQDKERFGTAKL
jgi:hypothetical protein